MSERLRPIDEIAARRAVLPEIVQFYLKYGELVNSPLITPTQAEKLRQERFEMLEIMKPQERLELINYGKFVTARINSGISV